MVFIPVEFQVINKLCNVILSTFGIQKIITNLSGCFSKRIIINLIIYLKMNALLTLFLLMTNFICQVIIDLVTWVAGLFS